MPVTTSYPGVYIEEVRSQVRTITGVATSITAFVGRTRKGPVHDPLTLNGFGDFERRFGARWERSPLSFSVDDYFRNGGSQAVVVRLFRPYFATEGDRTAALTAATNTANAAAAVANTTIGDVIADAEAEAAKPENSAEPRKSAAKTVVDAIKAAATGMLPAENDPAKVTAVKAAGTAAVGVAAPITKAQITLGTAPSALGFEAADEGAWGNNLRIRVDHQVRDADPVLFNLSIRDMESGDLEIHRNVSVATGHARRVDRVLANESRLLRVRGTLPTTRPAAHTDPTPGADPFGASTSAGTDAAGIASDGSDLTDTEYLGSEAAKTGIYALAKTDLVNLLVIPPYARTADSTTDVGGQVWTAAANYCAKRRAMLLVDAPSSWKAKDTAKTSLSGSAVELASDVGANACLFFPWIKGPNTLAGGQIEDFAPAGAIAGIFARTDAQRGVWKAPAGLDASLRGVPDLTVRLNDEENGELNPLGINCLRSMGPAGRLVWGARTRRGDDRLASEWKYIPVRRTALFIEESLYRGTQWVVFEPNDEPLWAQIRLNVGAFMHGLFRQSAFQGKSPSEAYFVKCDKETTTQNDIDKGVVNVIVGFAPLKPAEFVIIKIQQIAGQLAA